MTSRREQFARFMSGTKLDCLTSRLHPWSGLVVLNYHRIGDPTASLLDRNVFSGTADQLGHHIDLVRQHADLIAPEDVASVLEPSAPKGRHVLITFDDGYRDNYDLALPVLLDKGARAIFFVNSGFLDMPRLPWNDEISWMVRGATRSQIDVNRWWDVPVSLAPDAQDLAIARITARYIGLNSDPVQTTAFLDDLGESTGSGRASSDTARDLWMTWDMVREMQASGMEIAGHTMNHPVLAEITESVQEDEIAGVRERLIAETGTAPVSFSYPYGGLHQFTEATKSIVARSGYGTGYSFYGGYNVPCKTDRFDIRRLYMTGATTDTALIGLLTLPQLYGLIPPKLPWMR